MNATPMRRVAQGFVIATKTSIDVHGLEIPEHITDSYFKKAKKTGDKSKAGIFAVAEKEVLFYLNFTTILILFKFRE